MHWVSGRINPQNEDREVFMRPKQSLTANIPAPGRWQATPQAAAVAASMRGHLPVLRTFYQWQ